MIKVCHIISGDLWAGAEVMAYHLLKGLLKYNDMVISCILLNSGRLADDLRGLIPYVQVYEESKMPFPLILWKTIKFIDSFQPDIIHAHRYKENILAFLATRAKKMTKLVSTRHGLPELNVSGSSIKTKTISRIDSFFLSKGFHAVVAVSQEGKKFMIKEGCSEEKVKLIPNGIEIPDNSLKERRNEKFVIGSAGRLYPIKDYPLMIEVARETMKRKRDIIFKLAGDGPEKDRLSFYIQKYKLEKNFKMEGYVSNMKNFYKELDLFISTSVHEGIPISVLEAMAFELPIIAPLVGGLPEIIEDGVHGYLINSRNPVDFAERCETLYKDEELRIKMGKASRKRVEDEFSMEKMCYRYYELYKNLMN